MTTANGKGWARGYRHESLRWLLAGAITTDLQPQLETIERLTGANLRNPRAAPNSPRVITRLRRSTARSRPPKTGGRPNEEPAF